MRVRLGYVAISKALGKKVTSSSTVTFTNYNKITLPNKKLEKLKRKHSPLKKKWRKSVSSTEQSGFLSANLKWTSKALIVT